MKVVELATAAAAVVFVGATILTHDADAAEPTPTPLPTPSESISLGPAPSTAPTPEVEVGEARQARVRVVVRTCSRVVTVVEEREGSGPWKVTDRRVRHRHVCPVPTAVAGGR